MEFNYINIDLCKKWVILAIPIALLTAGCAGPSVSKSLEQARSEYAMVQADPKISANAQVATYEAGEALKAAEQADNIEKQEHLSYIAEEKSKIAIAVAQKNMADREFQELTKKKNDIIMKSRELEVAKAKEEANTSRSQAELARQQAESARQQAEQSEAKAKQMEAELSELKGKLTDRGIVLTLGDVLFDTGKAALKPGATQVVDRLANFLQKHTDRNVVIEGHTDSVGGEEYNIQLSQRRADSVRDALIEKGIDANRVATKGYGKRLPVASNKTAAGRQYNRRVEVVVLNPGVSPDSVNR